MILPDHSTIYIYRIWSPFCEGVYVGKSTRLKERWSVHKSQTRFGSMRFNPLYAAMRQIGVEKFRISVVAAFPALDSFAASQCENENMMDVLANGQPLFNKARPRNWGKQIMDRARARRKAKGE